MPIQCHLVSLVFPNVCMAFKICCCYFLACHAAHSRFTGSDTQLTGSALDRVLMAHTKVTADTQFTGSALDRVLMGHPKVTADTQLAQKQ